MATINGNAFSNFLVGTSLADTMFGLAGDDILSGGAGNDRLDGGSGDDMLSGGSGNDRLDGGLGADVMSGGTGNDLYIVDSLGDMVVETNPNGGIDSVISSVSHRLGNHVETLALSGNGNLQGWGNELNNSLTGNNGNNQMFGLGGSDRLVASAGSDVMDGGTGFDTVDYSNMNVGITLRATGVVNKGTMGNDQIRDVELIIGATNQINQIDASSAANSPVSINVDLSQERLVVNGIPQLGSQTFSVRNFANVFGTSQADSILGNGANNILRGAGGNDVLSGAAGNDLLEGGTGNDRLWGGLGNDILRGDSGNDRLQGDAGDDQLEGGTGADVLLGGTGNDSLLGGSENDNLTGESGNDILVGGSGSDILSGGSGNDILSGYGFTISGEIDRLTGGTGRDVFVLGDANGSYYREPIGGNNVDSSFALIEDWDFRQDFLQLFDGLGYTAESRALGGYGTGALDTVITSSLDGNIVAILQDQTNFVFSRDVIFV